MVSSLDRWIGILKHSTLALVVPHHRNQHRPLLIRSHALYFFIFLFLTLQFLSNYSVGSGKVLGFATNISVSEVIDLTNQERQQNGLQTLKTNSSLSQAAALKADDMFTKDYWAHFAPDGTSPWYFFSVVGYNYTWAGENLARDFSTSAGVVSAWMASPGHRANILNSNFTEIGLAVVNGNLAGEDTTLVVQLFAQPLAGSSAPSSNAPQSTKQPVPTVETPVPSTTVPVASTPSAVAQEQPKVATAAGIPTTNQQGFDLVTLVKNATTGQKVSLILLAFLVGLLIFDSLIIFRVRKFRNGSHSLAHASVLILLIGSLLLYGKGFII